MEILLLVLTVSTGLVFNYLVIVQHLCFQCRVNPQACLAYLEYNRPLSIKELQEKIKDERGQYARKTDLITALEILCSDNLVTILTPDRFQLNSEDYLGYLDKIQIQLTLEGHLAKTRTIYEAEE